MVTPQEWHVLDRSTHFALIGDTFVKDQLTVDNCGHMLPQNNLGRNLANFYEESDFRQKGNQCCLLAIFRPKKGNDSSHIFFIIKGGNLKWKI
jgi:hypothetical protein